MQKRGKIAMEERKTFSKEDPKSKFYADQVGLLVDSILESDAKWVRGWNMTSSFMNYCSNRPYVGGLNNFLLTLHQLATPSIGSELKSGYYVTEKEARAMGWKLKLEFYDMSHRHAVAAKALGDASLTKEERAKAVSEYLSTFVSEDIYCSYFEGEQLTDKDGTPRLDDKGNPMVKESFHSFHYPVLPVEAFDRSAHEIKTRKLTKDVAPLEASEAETKANATLDAYMKAEGIPLYRFGNECYYVLRSEGSGIAALCEISVPGDCIVLSPSFKSSAMEVAVKAHECGHSTMASERLNRKQEGGMTIFGPTDGYSKEELVAESCSLFFTQKMGCATDETIRNAFAYLKGYTESIRKGDAKNNLIAGLNAGQKASEFIYCVGTTGKAPEKAVRDPKPSAKTTESAEA